MFIGIRMTLIKQPPEELSYVTKIEYHKSPINEIGLYVFGPYKMDELWFSFLHMLKVLFLVLVKLAIFSFGFWSLEFILGQINKIHFMDQEKKIV